MLFRIIGYCLGVLPVAGAIRIDGRLDDPEWLKPHLRGELVQQSPTPGGPTPYPTRFRVLIERDRLLLGLECDDPDPARIAVHTLRRDGEQEGDDSVAIVLDTYGDRRTGYWFQVNAAGARVDGLISGPEHASLDWDGIWDARTARTAQGWSAEIAIPAQTLTFQRGLRQWGLNLERHVARERIVLRWHSPTLDSFLFDLSRAGQLSGVEVLRQGRGIEISPFAVGRMREYFGQGPRAWPGQTGLDITWRVAPQLAAVFTANTDFAETEVDSRQLNLTRFPLFFPERRAFFLEGSNQFEFGLGLGSTFVPFFSRRVGLLGGNQIPIDAGVKLSGRAGRWNIGFLDVQTRASRWAPSVNLTAGRFSYDVNRELRVGTVFTSGDPAGRGANTLLGFDGVWRTSKLAGDKNFLVGGWAAVSRRDGLRGDRKGWGVKVDYPNDRWDCSLTWHRFGAELNPGLGFLPRPGTRQFSPGCSWMPRPSRTGRWKFIRRWYVRNRLNRYDNLAGFNETLRGEHTVNVAFNSGEQLEFEYSPQREYLPASFELEENLTLRQGRYRWSRFQGEFTTSPHRQFQAGVAIQSGSFYNGRLLQQEAEAGWTHPRGRFSARLAAEQNFGRLAEGSFVQRLWRMNLAYAWSPNVVLTSLSQYDNESSDFGFNTRLRWTLKPGNDLFVIWNRGWRRLTLSPLERGLHPEAELVAVKLRWTFRP